jgi:hypothetical protein
MNRINIEKETQEASLRAYFKKELDSREKEIKDLKQQIA